MILIIDNYDSFVYNLARYIGRLNYTYQVKRNDAISLEEITTLNPSHIIISPGPKAPKDSGISVDVIRHFTPVIPILGVCLGHQALGYAFGGVIERAPKPMHGKDSLITHNSKDIFSNLPAPLSVGRYHSLVVTEKKLPECLQVTARTEDNIIMGLRHREYPAFGVQFHPESILTQHGLNLLQNFLHITL